MGVKVDQEPHSQSTVGTAAHAVAAVPSAGAYALEAVPDQCTESNRQARTPSETVSPSKRRTAHRHRMTPKLAWAHES
jgi:hypothetical protein